MGKASSGEQKPNAVRPKPPFKVLYSNDFTNIQSCVSPYHSKGQEWTPEMLEATVDETAGTGVEVHMPALFDVGAVVEEQGLFDAGTLQMVEGKIRR